MKIYGTWIRHSIMPLCDTFQRLFFWKLCCNFGGKASPSSLLENIFLHSGLSSRSARTHTTFPYSPKLLYTKILFAATASTLRYLILFLLRFYRGGAHCFSLRRRGQNEQAKKALFPFAEKFPLFGKFSARPSLSQKLLGSENAA